MGPPPSILAVSDPILDRQKREWPETLITYLMGLDGSLSMLRRADFLTSLLIGLYLLVFHVMRATELVGYHCHPANVRLTPLLFAILGAHKAPPDTGLSS